MDFIQQFRSTISPDITASGKYSFKAFLIQVANHKSQNALPKVQQGLGNPKVLRSGKEVDKFNLDVHRRCWRKFKIRPPTGSQNPEATDWKFCIYDEMHKDYGYTPAWVKLLVEKLKDEAEFESLYDSAHMNLAADQTT